MARNFIDKIIDALFNMKRSTFYLLIITFLGFILRLIAAINLSVAADDMHFVTHALNFFSSGRLVTYDQSAGLWFAFTSIMYKILGTTQLASRFAALLFGSLSILLIYFLAKEFFNEKISLFTALLLAISPFHIKNTVAEMDAMAMFFVLSSMLFFIYALRSEKIKFYLISGISMGLAIYTKVYPLLFIPSLLIYFVYIKRKEQKKIFTKRNIKYISLFLLTAFIFTIPALTHNYLLYKDKGFLDLQFTRALGLGKNISEQYYGWDYQFNAKNDWRGVFLGNSIHQGGKGLPLLLQAINFFRENNPLNFYLGILGIFVILFVRKQYKNYILFFFFSILFILPFLASIILLGKHFIFLDILLVPFTATLLNELSVLISRIYKKSTFIIIVLLIGSSLIILGLNYGLEPFYAKSHIAQMIDFKDSNIPKNSLIIIDSRVYRGRINWVAQGRPYFEGTDFLSVINQQDKLPGNPSAIDVYYFECVPDDCGWGTVKNQPDFNASMESLTDFFKQNARLVATIEEPEEKPYYPLIKGNKMKIINIYNTKISAKDSLLALANQPKVWFLYSTNYMPVEEQFDYYKTNDLLDKLLDKIAHLIAIIALILTFISIIYVIYLIFKE